MNPNDELNYMIVLKIAKMKRILILTLYMQIPKDNNNDFIDTEENKIICNNELINDGLIDS